MENSTFPIKISKLVDIVSKYETRSFAEEVDYLEECEEKNIEWLFNDLQTHP